MNALLVGFCGSCRFHERHFKASSTPFFYLAQHRRHLSRAFSLKGACLLGQRLHSRRSASMASAAGVLVASAASTPPQQTVAFAVEGEHAGRRSVQHTALASASFHPVQDNQRNHPHLHPSIQTLSRNPPIRIPTPRPSPSTPRRRTRRPRRPPQPSLQPLLRRIPTPATSRRTRINSAARTAHHARPPARIRLHALVAARALARQRTRGRSWRRRQRAVRSSSGRLRPRARRRQPPTSAQALRRGWCSGRGRRVPQVVQATSVPLQWRRGLAIGAAAAGGSVVALLLLLELGLGRVGSAVVGVWGQPGREGAGFFGVVGAEDARDVRVVFGVAVVFVGEEGAAQGGVAGGCVCEEVGEVGGHDCRFVCRLSVGLPLG